MSKFSFYEIQMLFLIFKLNFREINVVAVHHQADLILPLPELRLQPLSVLNVSKWRCSRSRTWKWRPPSRPGSSWLDLIAVWPNYCMRASVFAKPEARLPRPLRSDNWVMTTSVVPFWPPWFAASVSTLLFFLSSNLAKKNRGSEENPFVPDKFLNVCFDFSFINL